MDHINILYVPSVSIFSSPLPSLAVTITYSTSKLLISYINDERIWARYNENIYENIIIGMPSAWNKNQIRKGIINQNIIWFLFIINTEAEAMLAVINQLINWFWCRAKDIPNVVTSEGPINKYLLHRHPLLSHEDHLILTLHFLSYLILILIIMMIDIIMFEIRGIE